MEWGVKVYAASAAAQEPSAEPSAAASGRDYLRRRSAQRRASEQAWEHTEEGARRVHETLAALAEGARLHPPQDVRLSGEADRNVLNAAYLMPREESEAFAERVGRAGRARGRAAAGADRPVGAVLLRRRRGQRTGPSRGAMTTSPLAHRQIALVDLLDRLLAGGVVITGDVTLRIADVDLVRIDLRALISSVNENVPSPWESTQRTRGPEEP